jgi:peptidylprolyl isomerase
MRELMVIGGAVLLGAAAPPKKPLTPNDVVASAPASAWSEIPAADLLLIDLAGERRVVVQLAPQFAPAHVRNIRALARATWWQGAAVYRVQDNYVAQWGLGDKEKTFPADVTQRPPHEYWRSLKGVSPRPLGAPDPYAGAAGFWSGWPVAYDARRGWAALPHCYGYVGVARSLAPDTGSGSELYAIIGHAPRQLDRNIAVAGRVIEGIEHLSSLPRGSEALGFYKDPAQHVSISSVRLAITVAEADRPRFEVMDVKSASFSTYLRLRANRSDDFYRVPAGGVDLCNVPVPVRKRKAAA